MTWNIVLIAAAASLIATATANAKSAVEPAAGTKPARQCFWTHQVTNFASSDSRIVNLSGWYWSILRGISSTEPNILPPLGM